VAQIDIHVNIWSNNTHTYLIFIVAFWNK